MEGWDEIRTPGRDSVDVAGVELRAGSRVRLLPRAGGDVFDIALAGRQARVEAVEEGVDGQLMLAVTVEDDPGQDLGVARQIGHRFFFAPDEVDPLPGEERRAAPKRVLVAGIGNVFMADDGFGVELARRLAGEELPAGVEVRDFGIRGMDLVYALGEGCDAALLLDAVPRGEPPGTLSVIEPDVGGDELALDTHGMDPARVLALARELGPMPERTLVVGCEPLVRRTGEEDDVLVELSEPVRAAVEAGVELVASLLDDLTAANHEEAGR